MCFHRCLICWHACRLPACVGVVVNLAHFTGGTGCWLKKTCSNREKKAQLMMYIKTSKASPTQLCNFGDYHRTGLVWKQKCSLFYNCNDNVVPDTPVVSAKPPSRAKTDNFVAKNAWKILLLTLIFLLRMTSLTKVFFRSGFLDHHLNTAMLFFLFQISLKVRT